MFSRAKRTPSNVVRYIHLTKEADCVVLTILLAVMLSYYTVFVAI